MQSGFISIADIVRADVEGGIVRVTLGDSTDGSGIDREIAQWGLDGFISYPNDPDDEGAAQALFLAEGQEKRILGTRDYRLAEKTADLEAGDRAIVSACDARFHLKRAANAIVLHAGDTTIEIKPGAIVLSVDGGASLRIDKEGVHVYGDQFAANTTKGSLGLVGGLPPVAPANSVIYGPSGQTGAPSATWTIAP